MDISKYVQAGETFSGAHWLRRLPHSRRFTGNCKSDTPDLTRNVKLLCATRFPNPLPERRRHRCPRSDHKASSPTVLNGSSRARVTQSGGISHGSGTRMLHHLYPYKRMTALNKPILKTLSSTFDAEVFA